jgi:glycosyltransferase involved in cell wall biosynthesis
LRIAFYGNTCNNFFAIARAVRRASDIDAHLFIDEDADWMQFPESEDPELRKNYPDWIHKGPYHSMAARFWPGLSPLVEELKRFDVVMVSGGGVRYAPFVDRRFIFYVTGWDLTMAPFPLRFITLPPTGVTRKGAALLGGFWQRRGIDAIGEIWSQPFSPFVLAAERLSIAPDRIVPKYFPILLDTDLYRVDPSARYEHNAHVRRMTEGRDFVVFHPSRMMLNQAPQFVDAGNWKGNDRLIEGFARFVRANPGARPALVMIDHAFSPDLAEAKRLVRALGIEAHVVWLEGPNQRGFDRTDLIPFYSVADVVADEFGIGWFGSVVVEGASMGKPVLCHVDESVMKQLYPWHPIVNARTADDVAERLGELYRDPAARKKRGEDSRRWAVDFHSIERAAEKYVQQIREVAGTIDVTASRRARVGS